jgi:hypothetical protein
MLTTEALIADKPKKAGSPSGGANPPGADGGMGMG